MKKLYFTIIFALIFFNVFAQQPFITKWEVPAQSLEITIPTFGSGYDYTIDFGDGTILNNVGGDVTHSYISPGIYFVSISGNFPRIHFGSASSTYKIIGVEQWGDIQWESMEEAFLYCDNLSINTTDIPDLTQVTSLRSMFSGVYLYGNNLNDWDVSNVTDMSSMFTGSNFHEPLDNWDVSHVTDMSDMFANTSFNFPIGNWDVSNVTDMSGMFFNANWFDQPLDNWDVSNVTNMSHMFGGGTNVGYFDQPLNNWDVSNVTDMTGMFENSIFNQPLDNWDVSSVVSMRNMFGGGIANNFNQPIGNWDVSNVTDMAGLFSYSYFNQPLNDWDVSNVTDMSNMFDHTRNFNHAIDNWDVSNVTDMSGMFLWANTFNQQINNWDVSGVTNMENMFYHSSSFNQPLNDWDVSNVTNFSAMFQSSITFNQPLDNWDISNATNLKYMFYQAEAFNQNFLGWHFNHASLSRFVSNSGLDIQNYDSLLAQLATSELQFGRLGAEGLEYCNQSARDYLINNQIWQIEGDVLSENCNFITGMVTYDENSTGCNSNSPGISGLLVNANDGNDNLITFSQNGFYHLGTHGTDITVSIVNMPEYFMADPVSAEVIFNTSNTEVVDFCVTATQTIEDLNITLIPLRAVRPGFEATYQLVIENRGTQIVPSVGISLMFDDSAQTFHNSTPLPVSQSSNQLVFESEDLRPFSRQIIDLTMETFAPPLVNGGDILLFTANVTPNENDYTPEDNMFVYEQSVVNSFDPNDKQVLQGDEIYLDEADEYLDYLIRFQNTGTASAINVRILDTLHPKLDWTTLRPLNASHDYRIEIRDGNHVEFIFDDIELPHEAGNEPESHGFIAYKIKPKSDVQIGDIITGNASIFFDFNAPIITNTVYTEIVDRVMGTENNSAQSEIVIIYPNPATDKLNLRSGSGIHLQKGTIYNLQGQKIKEFNINNGSIDIENLTTGMYLLKIETNLNTINANFIKN